MDASGLPILPEEVLDQILAHLEFGVNIPHSNYDGKGYERGVEDWNEDGYSWQRASIRAACLVDRTFHRLATPRLYATIVVAPNASLYPRLLRTFLERPALAKHVRNLVLHDNQELLRLDGNHSEVMAELHDSGKFTEALQSIAREDDWYQEWYDEAPAETYDKTILLAICTSLQFLGLTLGQGPKDFTQSLLTLLEERGDEFQHLREIRVEGTGEFGGLDDLQYLLQLPRLESFVGHQLFSDEMNRVDFEEISSSITKAEFYESSFEAAGICGFLDACPRLRSLMIEWTADYRSQASEPMFGDIGRVLAHHGTALETLDLRAQHAWYLSSGVDPPPPFGDLSPLSSLRHFAAPATAFYDGELHEDPAEDSTNKWYRKMAPDLAQMLPKNLETFRIYDAYEADATNEINDIGTQLLQLMSDPSFDALSKIFIENETERLSFRPLFDEAVLPAGWTCNVIPANEDGRRVDFLVDTTVLERNLTQQ